MSVVLFPSCTTNPRQSKVMEYEPHNRRQVHVLQNIISKHKSWSKIFGLQEKVTTEADKLPSIRAGNIHDTEHEEL